MKKLMIVLFSVFTLSANAQDISFQLVTGLGGAFSFGELRAYGISAAVEPKIFIGNNIAAGLRFEGDVLFGGSIDPNNTADISVGMSSRAAQTIKGEYYFTDIKVRPYAGLGVGRFTQANIGASGSGDATLSASSGFGVAPEAGIALGNFRLSAIYNIVPGKNLVEITVGDAYEVSKNYLVLQMSWKVFGIR
ncbi:MAG: hypothetical protein WD578_03485 [Bacteroidales bacterium]